MSKSIHRAYNLALASVIATGLSASIALGAEAYRFNIARVPTPTAELLAGIDKVCAPGAFKLSSGARFACDTHSMPALVSDGTRFASRGIGGEFNALLTQVAVAAQ